MFAVKAHSEFHKYHYIYIDGRKLIVTATTTKIIVGAVRISVHAKVC